MLLCKEEGIAVLEKLRMDSNIRPEKLSLEDYANIANLISKK